MGLFHLLTVSVFIFSKMPELLENDSTCIHYVQPCMVSQAIAVGLEQKLSIAHTFVCRQSWPIGLAGSAVDQTARVPTHLTSFSFNYSLIQFEQHVPVSPALTLTCYFFSLISRCPVSNNPRSIIPIPSHLPHSVLPSHFSFIPFLITIHPASHLILFSFPFCTVPIL